MKVRHDKGGGITEISKKHFENAIRGVVPIEITVNKAEPFSFQLYSISTKTGDAVVILESGFNCGYSGEGPHGTAWALEKLGVPKNVISKVFTKSCVKIDFRGQVPKLA